MHWLRQLSLTQKCSLAIGGLLCFELVLLFSLDKALVDADKDLQRATIANSIATQVATTQDTICDLFVGGLYRTWVEQSVSSDTSPMALKSVNQLRSVLMALQGDSIPQSSRTQLEDVENRMAHMLALTVKTRAIPQELLTHLDKIGIFHKESMAMMAALDEISDKQILAVERSKQARRSRENIRQAIIIGAISNVVAALLLLGMFNSTVAKRLIIIRQNADRLVDRQKLLEPLEGCDEIASVDKSFHQMALKLQELDQVKRQFFASISHDIRSPLKSISATVTSLAESSDFDMPEAVRNRLMSTARSCQRVVQIVTDLLDLEKIEGGHLELQIEEVQLGNSANEAIETLTGLLEQKKLNVSTDIDDVSVLGDKIWLTQVITNLLSNAIKFSPTLASLHVRVLRDGEFGRLEVTDHGPGIAPENHERIFAWFKQTIGQQHSGGSSGLGLAIARRVIEQHQGKIGVSSEPGQGATFWFTVPLVGGANTPINQVALLLTGEPPCNNATGFRDAGVQAAFPKRKSIAQASLKGIGGLNLGQKNVLAIASLLVFELVQLFCLDGALVRAEAELRQSLVVKMITIETCRFQTKLAETLLQRYSFAKTQSFGPIGALPNIKDLSRRLRAVIQELPDPTDCTNMLNKMEERMRTIFESNEENPLSIARNFNKFQEMRNFGVQLIIGPRGLKLNGEKLSKPADQSSSRLALQQAIMTGAIMNVTIVILLAMAFNSEIVTRLAVIRRNADLLSRGKPLLRPLKGTDEIANLDHNFHQMAKQLEELEKLKRQFFAAISHDIRSPLSSVLATLTLMSETRAFPLSDEAQQRLLIASRNCSRIVQIVTDFLDMEKIEEGQIELYLEEFPLLAAVETGIESLIGLAEQKNISVVPELKEANLIGDYEWITQAVTNLLANAIKFSPENGVIAVKIIDLEDSVKLEISDQGAGIPPEQKEEIFNWFKQTTDQKSARGSSGLGLAIARRIVEQHHGEIGVSSNFGAGSTFWFSVPKVQEVQQVVTQPEQPLEMSEPFRQDGLLMSLKFMALPVCPVLTMLGILVVVSANGDTNEKKRLQTQALRDDASMSMKLEPARSLKLFEQAWKLEKLQVESGTFPCSYYDCAKYYARSRQPERAEKVLVEGLALLNRYEKLAPSAQQQQRTIACEKMRDYVLLGDLALRNKEYQNAERYYSQAFSCVPLKSVVSSVSCWMALRLAARGWCKCPPNTDTNSDATVRKLLGQLPEESHVFVGPLFDTLFVDEREWSAWTHLKHDVEASDDPAARIHLIDNYVAERSALRPVIARRLYSAGFLCRLIGEPGRALKFHLQSIKMLKSEAAPNIVALIDAVLLAATSEAQLNNQLAALTLREEAKLMTARILPPELLPISEANVEVISSLCVTGKVKEALPLINEQLVSMKQAFLQDRQCATGLLQAVMQYEQVMQKMTPNDLTATAQKYLEALEMVSRNPTPSVVSTRFLEALLRIYCTEESQVSSDVERLKRCDMSIRTYERFKSLTAPSDAEICCRLLHAKAIAAKKSIKQDYRGCVAACDQALVAIEKPEIGTELRQSIRELRQTTYNLCK